MSDRLPFMRPPRLLFAEWIVVALKTGLWSIYPEGPSTLHSRTLVPKTNKDMVWCLEAESLNTRYLDPLGTLNSA